MRGGFLLPLAMLGACGVGDSAADREQRADLKVVRAALTRLKSEVGGSTARVLSARLVGGRTVCGTVDGHDGFVGRRFGVTGDSVVIEQLGDPKTAAAIERACTGASREVVSRNAEFTDLGMADAPR